MKWQNITFKSAARCLICKEGLESAGIETGDIFRISSDGYWCLPWLLKSEIEWRIAYEVIAKNVE